MPAQFIKVRRWLSEGQKDLPNAEADIEGNPSDSAEDEERDKRRRGKRAKVVAFVWREGKAWTRLNCDRELRPGDTVVLREQDGGWETFGYIPDGEPIDVADEARFQLRRRVHLRLHPRLIENWPECESRKELLILLAREDLQTQELRDRLKDYPAEQIPPSMLNVVKAAADSKVWVKAQLWGYPDGQGYVFTGRLAKPGEAERSPTRLINHSADVARCSEWHTSDFLPSEIRSAVKLASQLHDCGKVDLRFQTWLRGGDELAARLAPFPIAKSGRFALPKQGTVGLPKGFRHELLSLLFAHKKLAFDQAERDLILHLVASHHGECRPFAPVVIEEDLSKVGCVEWDGTSLCREERLSRPAHNLASGVAERFWSLNRRFGWWGLAYLEGLVRLADWKASSDKEEEVTEYE